MNISQMPDLHTADTASHCRFIIAWATEYHLMLFLAKQEAFIQSSPHIVHMVPAVISAHCFSADTITYIYDFYVDRILHSAV